MAGLLSYLTKTKRGGKIFNKKKRRKNKIIFFALFVFPAFFGVFFFFFLAKLKFTCICCTFVKYETWQSQINPLWRGVCSTTNATKMFIFYIACNWSLHAPHTNVLFNSKFYNCWQVGHALLNVSKYFHKTFSSVLINLNGIPTIIL